jgi:hypothetical protein
MKTKLFSMHKENRTIVIWVDQNQKQLAYIEQTCPTTRKEITPSVAYFFLHNFRPKRIKIFFPPTHIHCH